MMTTGAPQTSISNAWLIKADSSCLQNLYVECGSGSALEPGDAVLLCGDHADVSVLYGYGRVFRVRKLDTKTTIFFDAFLKFENSVELKSTVIQIADWDKFKAIRLDWTSFVSVLKPLNLRFNDLKTITGTSAKEQAYIRKLLEVATIDDLLGPAAGPDEEIIGMSVRDRYLVGKLAPRIGLEDNDFIEGLQGPTTDEGNLREVPAVLLPFQEDGSGKNKAARRRLPGEEFSSVGGAADPDDDDLVSVDASKNQSFVPSSIGVTVCIDENAKHLEIDVRWGRYYKTASETTTDNNGKPKRAWKRIPSGGKLSIPLEEGPIRPTAPDPNCPKVLIQGTIRAVQPGSGRMVTIFLVNNQPELQQNQDEAWLFQPEVTLKGPENSQIFHRKPAIQELGLDKERESLEMIYRQRIEFAVGHCISVHATCTESLERATEIRTVVIPDFEVATTETPGTDPEDRPAMIKMVQDGFLDMEVLGTLERSDLILALSIITDDYKNWILEQESRNVPGYESSAKSALHRCREILERLVAGIQILAHDDKALEAFRFANLAMATQRIRSIFALHRRRKEEVEIGQFKLRQYRSWRPFQLAFILLSIPALANPLHKDRTTPLEAFADLLWFPTGGGKTEAYLGVAAFAMAIRRLQVGMGGLDSTRGLAVIMRYTLRLLTLQQFQRATTLICAMEVMRRDNETVWGRSPFTLGLWVGQKVTPNDTEESHEAIEAKRTNKRPTRSSPAQLTSCPWCGTEIAAGRDIEVRRTKNDVGKTLIYCGDKFGRCEFSRTKSRDSGLPIILVDDELYRRPPSMLIATVDKFAMMAWRGQVRTLFGICKKECKRHGLLWEGAECTGRHTATGALAAVSDSSIACIRPPDLIIQDEFHLISGPLGTMVGLYETAIDELATWRLEGQEVRPKIIASTATVRKAAEQVNNVFMRRVSIFPPHGLDIEDNFFAVQRSLDKKPGRLYLGICAPGSARPAVLIRVYTALLTASQALFERFGEPADPWMTLVGYFNSLRELGGMRRLAEDDVQTRSYRVQMSNVLRPGLAQRNVKNVDELTSRVQSKDIPTKLDQLEIKFQADLQADGKHKVRWIKGETQPMDVVLASNMLSVGVDVNRLGLMVVNGQPKSTAEYIQATSRVGRSFPGLVCTVLTWSRPRDLSHYESFEHYHGTFYKHVEAQSVTPFAPRALDRGLMGTMVSLLRLKNDEYNPNLGAGKMNSSLNPEADEIRTVISNRGWRVVGEQAAHDLTADMVGERLDEWIKEANRGGRRLGYEAGKSKKEGQGDVAGLLRKPGIQAWDTFTAPMSLREVEADVRLVMSADHLPEGPEWKASIIDDEEADD